jgi:hypothetical protein
MLLNKRQLTIIIFFIIFCAVIYSHSKETNATIHKINEDGCIQCHKNMENHHKIGMKLKNKISPEILLSKDNKVNCFSCHNISLPRFDNVSWSAESLFSNMLSFKSKYKTYYLRKRNNKGQLCKQCHY